jgi:choloylglycine hydrolase
MDWFNPINTFLYQFPKNQIKTGLSDPYCKEHQNISMNPLKWESHFSSIGSVIGDEYRGYSTVDGMNSEGLAVNALFDTDASYGISCPLSDTPQLSILRWAQFTLDMFENVSKAVEYYESNPIHLVMEDVPDGSKMKTKIHLTLSDATGDSAIIEVRLGKISIFHNEQYRIATNQPSYDMQLTLTEYWQYVWGTSDVRNSDPIYTAPGGVSATQRFERASFYTSFSKPANNEVDSITQARSLVATCAVPEHFNPQNSEHASYTIWTNVSAHLSKTYFLFNTYTMSPVWLVFNAPFQKCQRVCLIEIEEGNHPVIFPLSGNIAPQLIDCNNPYA